MTPEEAEDIQFETSRPISHKKVIEKALSEGKPVPFEVLNDYPELKIKQNQKSIDLPFGVEKIKTNDSNSEKTKIEQKIKGFNVLLK
jgi:hypothetical protein